MMNLFSAFAFAWISVQLSACSNFIPPVAAASGAFVAVVCANASIGNAKRAIRIFFIIAYLWLDFRNGKVRKKTLKIECLTRNFEYRYIILMCHISTFDIHHSIFISPHFLS